MTRRKTARHAVESPGTIKVRQIKSLLTQPIVDVAALRALALHSDGFVLDEIRRLVWPYLLNISEESYTRYTEQIIEHKDTQQIERDIDRSLWRFTAGSRHHVRLVKRKELSDIINALVCIHPDLHYYQGYHDLCSVFLLVMGKRHAYPLCERVSLSLARHCLSSNLHPVMNELSMLFPLIEYEDRELYDFLAKSQVQPYFAVSWLLTWGSHDVANFGCVTRLFDLFLVSQPTMPLYVCAAIVLDNRDRIMAVECDFAGVHEILGILMAATDMITDNVEAYITTALQLCREYPPSVLEKHTLQLRPELKKADVLGTRDAPLRIYPYSWMSTTQVHFDMGKAGEVTFGSDVRKQQTLAKVQVVGVDTSLGTKVSFWALMGTVLASAGAVALEMADVGLASLLG